MRLPQFARIVKSSLCEGIEKGRPPDFGSLQGSRVAHNIMQNRIDALPARGRLPKSFSIPSFVRDMIPPTLSSKKKTDYVVFCLCFRLSRNQVRFSGLVVYEEVLL